ncbi:hypothetical protein MIND_00814900 [Mycena indigotica]|uniref:Uncharacterized protein n=1 Tax=Mycena indigotica TaxID=2126181 RepID=A0A8H6SHY5_9AGAR|nr:uncharacterized protein MIND_00814900 [Mycena indigotica]KAF7298677.1 hypothetical protein MIND_00814900 [Mycena indigotica]
MDTQSPTVQIWSTLALAALSLIPHHALRVTAVVICSLICLAHTSIVAIRRPARILAGSAAVLDGVEQAIAEAMCGSHRLVFLEESLELLRLRRALSLYRSSLLTTHPTRPLSWMAYIALWSQISRLMAAAQRISLGVQLRIETSRADAYAERINSSLTLLGPGQPERAAIATV